MAKRSKSEIRLRNRLLIELKNLTYNQKKYVARNLAEPDSFEVPVNDEVEQDIEKPVTS